MGKKILMFEDDAFTAELNEYLLADRNYNVQNRYNVDHVLDDITDFSPDIILMDLRIPSIGGDKAIEVIKNNDNTKHIPIILYSADVRIENIANEVSADACLKKPFDIDEFVDLIEEKIKPI